MTIDEAALNAGQVNAKPFPILSVNSPNRDGGDGKFPVLYIEAPATPLTDMNTGNTFPVSLIGFYQQNIENPGSTKTLSSGIYLLFSNAKSHLSTQAWGRVGYPASTETIDDPLFYPRLQISNLKLSAWKKGTYVGNFKLHDLRTSDGSLSFDGGGKITPYSFDLTVYIPPILKVIAPTSNSVNLKIDNLSYFRNGLTSANPAQKPKITMQHTVPFMVSAKTPRMTYNGRIHTDAPRQFDGFFNIYVDNKNGSITDHTFQVTDIPIGNKTTLSTFFAIPSDVLKKNYALAGTYECKDGLKINLNEITWNGSPGLRNEITIPEFKVIVSDLKEIIIKDSQINLNFKTVSDYANGIRVTMPAHLRTSSTSPFNLTVKAESATFLLNGAPSELPCSILQLGPSSENPNIQRLNVSTSAQPLISNALPVIDHDIDVEYHIPPNPLLVPAKTGTYTLKLIYAMETL